MFTIFIHELKQYLRDVRLQSFVFFAFLAMAGFLCLLWPESDVFSVIRSSGRHIFSIILLLNLAIILSFVPALCACSVSDEKEKNRFVMLITTMLKPGDIMFGKLFAVITMQLFMVLFFLPVSALCLLSGGVNIDVLIQGQLIILISAICYGGVCLAVSASASSSNSALIQSYLLVALMSGAVFLPDLLLSQQNIKPLLELIRSFSPFDALYQLIYSEHRTLLGGGSGDNILKFLAFNILIFIISCFVFRIKLLSRNQTKARQSRVKEGKSIFYKLMFIFDTTGTKRLTPMFINPIFMAELRSKMLGNPRFLLWTFSTCNAISIVLLIVLSSGYSTHLGQNSVEYGAVIYQLGLTVLIAPGVCASSISEDVNSGNLLFVRMSQIGAFRYVLGKLYAGFIYIFFIMACSIPVIFSLNFLQDGRGGNLLPMIWLLASAALCFICAGLFFSAVSKTSAGATAASYIFAFTVTVGSLSVLLFSDKLGEELMRKILMINPVAGGLRNTDRVFTDFLEGDFWQINVLFLIITAAIFSILGAIKVRQMMSRRKG
ncbi:ABC transporter permease [Lentisphaera profundi]|uniref:ABC transporter permease n=1 Tax=Lentisphaera profundi TaxID=1658616 RepID=A0ABY7VQT9_9BACT|nr:ABC transporter permease [Lentisphaera profundi]WDE95684.1 ABC transporter permease [Lentisphaera profundi]